MVVARNLALLIRHMFLVTKTEIRMHPTLNIVMQLAVKLQSHRRKRDRRSSPLHSFD